jgi:hypothetical protein
LNIHLGYRKLNAFKGASCGQPSAIFALKNAIINAIKFCLLLCICLNASAINAWGFDEDIILYTAANGPGVSPEAACRYWAKSINVEFVSATETVCYVKENTYYFW